jgi:O-antigen/teichoic acid export membrane protein
MEQNNTALGSLRSVLRGAGFYFAGRISRRLIGALTNVILTRTLGPALYGIYAYISIVFRFVRIFTELGGDMTIIRYLPEYRDNATKQRMVVTLAYITSLIASIIMSVSVYYAAPMISRFTLSDPLFIDVLQIGALIIPFTTLSNITLSVFRGVERMKYHVGISDVASPIFRLIFIGGAVVLGYSVIGATAGLIVSAILTFGVGIFVLFRTTDLTRPVYPTTSEARNHYSYSVPLTFNNLGNALYNQVDVLMVGILLSGSAVGVYRIAILVAGFLLLPLIALNQLFPAVASRLYQNGQSDELRNVYSTVTRWSFSIALFPTITVLLYGKEILRVFGEGFVEGQIVLALIALSKFTSSAVGPSGYLLMMSDHQYLTMSNQVGSGVLNIILNYFLIIEFGFIGAAVATASVLALINVVRLAETIYLEGLQPYRRTFYKPITAALPATIVLYAASIVLRQYVLLVVGTILGGAVYLFTLYLLGLEQDDTELFKKISNY